MGRPKPKKGELLDFPGISGKDEIINDLIRNREKIGGIAVAVTYKNDVTETTFSVGVGLSGGIAGLDFAVYRLNRLKHRLLKGE